jgi:DNA invertase Pin-like site-specific DNA recombinase
MAISVIPAAQYLRMSTDHQQYSLGYQSDAIARYAAEHGFEVVKTYSDAARSGVRLKNRAGLKQLLKDVVDGSSAFNAVLVYDVSRWGRFQDSDEAAHYEYLCKSSGVPVHYCAEMFPNDNSMPGLIMKALKRSMAGEYSRELSIKVRAGLSRLTKQGFKAGGPPVYGLRRLLLDSSGKPKQLLSVGERKSLVIERVILVPGPAEEVSTVRRIFNEFANERLTLRVIADRLNLDGIPYVRGVQWNGDDVWRVLKHPHYLGRQVWGCTRTFLGSKRQLLPSEEWITCENAFEPIVDRQLFEKAQAKTANFTHNLSNDELLDRLRSLLKLEGRLTSRLIDRCPACPSLSTYHARFGGLLNAYQQIGYLQSDYVASRDARGRSWLVRNELIEEFVGHSGGQLESIRPSARFRALLRYRRTGLLIAVLLARYRPTVQGEMRWIVDPVLGEENRVTVLVLLDETNSGIKRLLVFARFDSKRSALREKTEVLQKGVIVEHPSQLLNAVYEARNLNRSSGRAQRQRGSA